MANPLRSGASPLYNSSLVNLYRSIGNQMGFSPAFQNASAAQGISESSLNPNAVGDSGASFGLHQWNRKASPERYQALLNVSKQMGLPPTDPRVQITHWYNENSANKGITDPRAANDAALASERPAGWKPGDPTGVPSYNKRLGDTMALMRLVNGQQPSDNSWQATGTDEQANAAMQPQAAQSISIGDQENTQPFNNIGSTLANVGAALASLDRHGTGIASLNASQVARNLTSQEALREKEDNPQLIGFNADKTMMMMRKGNQVYSVATPQGFGGPSNEDLTSNQKEYKAQQNDPAYADWVKNKDKLEPSLSQDTRRRYAIQAIKGDNTWTKEIGGDKQGAVDKRSIDEEITNFAKEINMPVEDIMKSRTEQRYRNKVADRIAQIDVNTETASNKIEAAANNLIETSKQYPRGDIRFLESIKQKWDEQTNDPKLQALKTAVDAFALDYATALNPQKTSPTVDDVRNARNKILTNMNQESLEAAVGIVQREIGSIRSNARRTHEQFFGSSEEQAPSSNKKTIRNTEDTKTKRLKFNPQTGELE